MVLLDIAVRTGSLTCTFINAVRFFCGSAAMILATIKASLSSTPSTLVQVGVNGILNVPQCSLLKGICRYLKIGYTQTYITPCAVNSLSSGDRLDQPSIVPPASF